MKTAEELRNLLGQIDRKSYPAYKNLKGSYRFSGYVLGIDHVQGDPFAAPSRVHIEVEEKTAGLPERLYDKQWKKMALEDALIRIFASGIRKYSFQAKGSGKSGLIRVTNCGQEVLERTAADIREDGTVILRFEVGFPANGRTVNARELEKIFFQYLPSCVQETLYYKNLDIRKLENVMELSEDQEAIRRQLKEYGLVAFVADGSVLPRMSGVSQKPMKDAVPFVSPESVRVTLELPYYGEISGMGDQARDYVDRRRRLSWKIYASESTGDGDLSSYSRRRKRICRSQIPDAVKIRAEDGRSIKHTDISMFISDLPNQKDTVSFDTEDASGSTSQAANVIEAMEAGASTFLIDEDTSATNFMVRDELMQKVIHKDMEPITPFIERMQYFYKKFGISTVLVAGSSGAYFQVADVIVQMDRYQPREITSRAKEATAGYQELQFLEKEIQKPIMKRCPKKNIGLEHRGRIKLKTLGKDGIMLGSETIDLRYVEQVADEEQLTCLGYLMRELETHRMNGKTSICELVESLYRDIERQGLKDVLGERELPGNLALPRKSRNSSACLNRYRGLQL